MNILFHGLKPDIHSNKANRAGCGASFLPVRSSSIAAIEGNRGDLLARHPRSGRRGNAEVGGVSKAEQADEPAGEVPPVAGASGPRRLRLMSRPSDSSATCLNFTKPRCPFFV